MVSEGLEVEELRHDGVELAPLGGIGHLDAVVVDEQGGLVEPSLPAVRADVLLDGLPARPGQGRGGHRGGLLPAAAARDLGGWCRCHRSLLSALVSIVPGPARGVTCPPCPDPRDVRTTPPGGRLRPSPAPCEGPRSTP